MTKPINLAGLLAAEADEILAVRSRASSYHAGGDIRAAGNEVEDAVRALVARHLPSAHRVGHGHVVDRHQRGTGQFDLIIYDALTTSLVSEATDGTGYYPYESVLAVGEVKTSYRRTEDPVRTFAEKLRELRSLDRDRPGGQSALVRHGFGAGITPPSAWPYRNPMFSFLISLESPEFSEREFQRLAAAIPHEERPSLICLLDRGAITHVRRPEEGRLETDWWPEFAPGSPWEVLQFRPEDLHGSVLALLFFGLGEHLSQAAVAAPDPRAYLPELRSWPLWREG
jgi:Domain of unknown function (DUF6602)